jgi:hypothetical protein
MIKMTFLAVESVSWAVRGGWPTAVVQIQCFYFSSRGDATRQNVAER